MPRKPRNNIKTPFIHVMTQGINKSYIFNEDRDIKYYISTMYNIKEKYSIKIIAYCIMNNHAHILIETNDVDNLSKYMQCLNTKYAVYYNKKYKRIGYVFRDRYRSEEILSENHLNNCIQYIYNNPIKAKICKKAEEYPYSNYKSSKLEIKGSIEKYKFMDIEEEEYGQIIREYMSKKNLKIDNLLKNKIDLRKMVSYLKNEEKISYRNMEKELGISRETLRKSIK